MSDVKLPEINARGQSRGENNQRQTSNPNQLKRQGSFNSGNGNSKSVFVAKKERKDIERDAQLLANRIALLKQEEQKTWKKIDETKRRAQEVMKAKMQNEERAQRKAALMHEEQMKQQIQREQLHQMKAQRENERKKIQDAMIMHKQEEAKQSKFINAQHKNKAMIYQHQEMQEKEIKHRILKQQEHLTKAKVEEYRRQKFEQAREDVARQIAEEEELIRQKEAEVMQMEMLEMELIKKLKNTQAIQKQAYLEMEEAINDRKIASQGEN